MNGQRQSTIIWECVPGYCRVSRGFHYDERRSSNLTPLKQVHVGLFDADPRVIHRYVISALAPEFCSRWLIHYVHRTDPCVKAVIAQSTRGSGAVADDV